MWTKSCGPCSGRGYWATRKDICSVCQGRGDLTFSEPKDAYQKCKPCSGKGHVSDTFFGGFSGKAADICRVCRGYGFVSKAVVR